MNRIRPILWAQLFALLACGDADPSTTGPSTISRIALSPASVDVLVGGSQTVSATAYDAANKRITNVAVSWQVTPAAIATVSQTGLVTGVSVGTATLRATIGESTATAPIHVTAQAPNGPVIQVTPSVTYQTMTGWEGAAQTGEIECNRQAFSIYRVSLLDRLVTELGINRVRLPLQSGIENPVDWGARYISGDLTGWRNNRYAIVNDNSDPFSANPAGFNFTSLNYQVDSVLQPLRLALAARGERLYVNLNYTDFGTSTFEHSSNPEEYAELIVTTFKHMQARYGWVPDAVEIILEPDNTPNWRPAEIGAAIVATGDRLKAAGFRPDFIAPSNANMASAVTYFDEIIQVPRVREYLTDLSYHRYGGVSAAALNAIQNRSQQFGVRTSMLEHIGSDHGDLHEDLKVGYNSAWQRFTLAYCGSDSGASYYVVDQSNPLDPRITMGSSARYLPQYFRFIRLGAVRIAAASGDSRFDPLAFRNANGKFAVVVKASSSGTMTVLGIPAGQYGVVWTTASQAAATSSDVQATAAGGATITIPAEGVITLFQR